MHTKLSKETLRILYISEEASHFDKELWGILLPTSTQNVGKNFKELKGNSNMVDLSDLRSLIMNFQHYTCCWFNKYNTQGSVEFGAISTSIKFTFMLHPFCTVT